ADAGRSLSGGSYAIFGGCGSDIGSDRRMLSGRRIARQRRGRSNALTLAVSCYPANNQRRMESKPDPTRARIPSRDSAVEQPPLDLLRWSAMPEAGAALRAAKQEILSRWRQAVKRALPRFDELTRRQLEDSLPDLLDSIAAALASDESATTEQLIARSPDHGLTRYHQEFSLNQLLAEYHILRRIMLEEMARELDR